MQLSKGTNLSKKRKSFPTSLIKFQSRGIRLREKIKFLKEFAQVTAGKVNGLELRLSDDFEKSIFSEQAICISKDHELLERIMKMLDDQRFKTHRIPKQHKLFQMTPNHLAKTKMSFQIIYMNIWKWMGICRPP